MSHFADMMRQIKKLKSGKGVQNVLDEVYKILGNPIVLFDTEYRLLAYTDVATDDPISNELIKYGAFSRETQRLFSTEGFIEEVLNTPIAALLKSEKLKYDRIAGKIINKNNTYIANLVIVASNKPFEKDDLMIFEAVCKLVSKEISVNELYLEYEQTHQEAILRSLIDDSYDMELDMAQVGIIYDALESGIYTVVVDISLCCPERADAAYFVELFKQAKPEYKYAPYSNYIIIIISTNEDDLNVNEALSELNKLFRQYNLYAGISGRFENLFELQKYYTQALNAVQYALDAGSDQRVFPCNQSSLEKMEQIKNLKNGEGIQYFLNMGPEIFGNPLLFHDMELNLLAYTGNVEIRDPIWQELITYGTSSGETIELFRTEGFINTMENTKGGAILISEKIKYDRISWRIYSNDNIMIGCVSIVNSDKPFTEDELVLFGAFGQKFSKEVGKIEFYNNYGRLYSGTVINSLISGKIDDYTFYSKDIGNLYDHLMENLYLIVVDTSRCESGQVNLTYFRDLFNWQGAVNRYAVYNDYIIIIISIGSEPLSEKSEFSEISRVFEQNNIYAGISSCFDNIYDLRKHYAEAVSALTVGLENKKQNHRQWIFLY